MAVFIIFIANSPKSPSAYPRMSYKHSHEKVRKHCSRRCLEMKAQQDQAHNNPKQSHPRKKRALKFP